eukprot:272969_1
MTSISLVAYASIAVLIILSGIAASWVYTTHILRNDLQIGPRKPTSSILAGILCIIGLMLTFPCTILAFNISIIPQQFRGVSRVLVLFTIFGLYHLLTFRAFMVYFDIKWHKALEDQQWRVQINPTESNWFLRNKTGWGNSKRVGGLLCTHLLFWTCMTFLMLAIHPEMVRLAMACSGLFPTICDIVMYLKFPKFDDVLFIAHEIKYILALKLFVIIGLSTASYIISPHHHSIESIAFSDLTAVSLFIYVYIMHYQPLKTCMLPTNPCRAFEFVRSDYNTQHELCTIESVATRVSDGEVSLKRILNNPDGFTNFARHLTRCFCIENLLFLVETQQWLSQFQSTKVVQNSENPVVDVCAFILPPNAPTSTIVTKGNEYDQSAQLFTKYIVNDAYFCINISSTTRDALYEQFGYSDDHQNLSKEMIVQHLKQSVSIDDLFHLFGESRKEVFRLLNGPYRAFMKTDAFQELRENILTDL